MIHDLSCTISIHVGTWGYHYVGNELLCTHLSKAYCSAFFWGRPDLLCPTLQPIIPIVVVYQYIGVCQLLRPKRMLRCLFHRCGCCNTYIYIYIRITSVNGFRHISLRVFAQPPHLISPADCIGPHICAAVAWRCLFKI